MHIKEISKRYENMMMISQKANSDKNVLTINIMKISRDLNKSINTAYNCQLFITMLQGKYNIEQDNDNWLKSIFNKHKNRELWVFISEPVKANTDPYSRYEKIILESNKNKKIDFIAVGEYAKTFCSNYKLNVIQYFDNEHTPLNVISTELSIIIEQLNASKTYQKVNVIINSNKNFDNYFTILPLNNFDISALLKQEDKDEEMDVKNLSFFPDLNSFIEAQLHIFLFNALNALLLESSLYNSKINLVNINKAIKKIDDTLITLNRQLIKIKRENELEEIITIAKNNTKDSIIKNK